MKIRDLVPWKERGISRWEEEHPFYSLQQEMNRLFDEFTQNFEFPSVFGNGQRFTPRVDVKETDTALEVTAELPGIQEEDIDLTITQNALTIKGEKKVEKEEKKENYYRMERSYGSFSRSIPLPREMVDAEKAEATFKEGVLTITLPKLPEAQVVSKHIPIKQA
ncbi:MAG TPA: Hsp20/alpha crystallin family protein [Anaerolineae bacterium]